MVIVNSFGKERRKETDSMTTDIDSTILLAVHSIRYGAVEITIHDSRVVQIECKEKIRFPLEGNKKMG